MFPSSETIECCGQSIGDNCSTQARSARPVPMAMILGCCDFRCRSISAAPAWAMPTIEDGASGSLGTTSQLFRPNLSFRRALSSMQWAMG